LQTIGDESRDFVAVQALMGHVPGGNDMGRERIDDQRLEAVTDHVRQWLVHEDQGGDEQHIIKMTRRASS
jgi:hypothetical protein